MANKTQSKRSLTVQQVIDLVESIDVPVLRIEKDLGIPVSVLQRALKEDTLKPLPVKYEQHLLDYVNNIIRQKKSVETKKEVVLAKTGLEAYQPETMASEEEMDSKRKWLEDVRLGRAAARVIDLFTK